jgi:hypothetical protein
MQNDLLAPACFSTSQQAAKLVLEARALNAKWGLFDDTPDKVSAALREAAGQ